MSRTPAAEPRRHRADGERSRRAILDGAARLATVEGLEGLSIGRLADHIGMSKSGLYAHFRSKEELQLATIDTAWAIFEAEVLAPAESIESPRARLATLCDSFISHVERGVFPGGCFFASAAAELDTHPGRVRDRVAATQVEWTRLLEGLVREAQATGEVDASEEPAQLAFELNSYLSMANTLFVLHGDENALARARNALRTRLAERP